MPAQDNGTTTVTIAATGITNDTQLLTVLVQTLRPYTKTISANLIIHPLISAANDATIAIMQTAANPLQCHNRIPSQQLHHNCYRHNCRAALQPSTPL